MRPARIHNLRDNKVERSPHRLLVWDVESHQSEAGRRQLHQLRVWCAEVVQRHGRRPRQPAVQAHQGTTATELADLVERSCRSSETVWAFAHNQGFDLTVTRLPLLLLARGWTITAHALASDSPWARLARGSHRLVLADSTSWLPGPLAGIGAQVGIPKPELPEDQDLEQEWAHRCRYDVRILTQALVELMDWWDRRRLGSWSVTGPQSGFNAMRHRPTPHTVVIDPDPGARQLERQALYGGRREVWRVGRQPWGDYRELDFQRAHATVAAHCPLPKRRTVAFERMGLDDWRLVDDRWAPLAWCSLEVQAPRYPLRVGGHLFYPIGRFRTLLAGPEIAEAARRGELRQVGPGYVYQLGQHMGWWGRWVLEELAERNPDTPEVARTAIKAWSRVVPGKWAGRTGRTTHSGPAAEQGWNLEHGVHHPSGAPVTVLDLAGRREVLVLDQDTDDCFPAVLAWIQSEVRVRLGRLIDEVGSHKMVSCNTDGLICEGPPSLAPAGLQLLTRPLVARQKAQHSWVDVISPQHLVLPEERRLSGVPASATEIAPRQYRWLTWPRMSSQIASGEARGYVREPRSVDLSKVPVNRWRWADGRCTPVEADLGEDGTTRLQGPVWVQLGAAGEQLAEVQHQELKALLSVEG